jgi:mannosyltransferase OCH1-like enzyme
LEISSIPKTIVWSYWEGPRPDYIQACLDSLKRVCSNFILVTPETVDQYIGDVLNSSYKKLKQIALKADCIRAALLAKYGGFWFDADTIGLKDPITLFRTFGQVSALYSVWDQKPLRVLNGYIYIAPNNPICQVWLNKINEVLKSNPSSAVWTSLGEHILTPLLTHQDSKAVRVPRATFLPIDIDSNVIKFFSNEEYQTYVMDSTVCFGLNHSWFMYHKAKSMDKSQWNSPILIHQLLRSIC